MKRPPHVIEVGGCWKYITIMKKFIRYKESGLNTTTDVKVREMLTDIVKEGHVYKLSQFMKKEGFPLLDVTSSKPNSEPNEIPLGVKLTDDESMNGVTF